MTLGVINYFRDHSTIAKPLFDMVALSTKHSTKLLTWTPEGQLAFERLKALFNNCPKFYFTHYLSFFTPTLQTMHTGLTYAK